MRVTFFPSPERSASLAWLGLGLGLGLGPGFGLGLGLGLGLLGQGLGLGLGLGQGLGGGARVEGEEAYRGLDPTCGVCSLQHVLHSTALLLDGIVQGRAVAIARVQRCPRGKEQLHDLRVPHICGGDEGRAAWLGVGEGVGVGVGLGLGLGVGVEVEVGVGLGVGVGVEVGGGLGSEVRG